MAEALDIVGIWILAATLGAWMFSRAVTCLREPVPCDFVEVLLALDVGEGRLLSALNVPESLWAALRVYDTALRLGSDSASPRSSTTSA
jgi:hypothetical protein